MALIPIKAQWQLNGSWVDVSSYVRGEGVDEIVINRGYQNEQGDSYTPATATFSLNNPSGRFSEENPAGPYYGYIRKNTEFRIGVDEGVTGLRLPYSSIPAYMDTADKAVLDITGDIDMRIDCKPNSWRPKHPMVLATKYDGVVGNQRSWFWYFDSDGLIKFAWSTDGTLANRVTASSTASIPVNANGERLSLRVTLDVNNGGGGWTATFYTSTSLSGTWTQLGATVSSTPTTSIFNSTANLTVGDATSGNYGVTGTYSFEGTIYGFELFNGIAGTKVADFDATVQAEGATSWSDGLGTPNTWTLTPGLGAEVTSIDRRFWGEVSAMTERQGDTQNNLWVEMTVSDLVRRLSQGAQKVNSPLFNFYNGQSNQAGYWPFESGSTVASPGSTSVTRPAKTRNVTYETDSALIASTAVAVLGAFPATIQGYANLTSSATYTTFICTFKFPSVPGAEVALFDLVNPSHSTARKFRIAVSATNFIVRAYDGDGAALATQSTSFGTGVSPDQWITMRVQLSTSGGNTVLEQAWSQLGQEIIWGTTNSTFLAAASHGRFTQYFTPASGSLVGVRVAHVQFQTASFIYSTSFLLSASAFAGEQALDRMIRVAAESGIPFDYSLSRTTITAHPIATELMGPQAIDTPLNIFSDCAKVDGGLLYSARRYLAMFYRSREDLYNQDPFSLDYSSNHFSGQLLPANDDLLTRNDVTLTRPLGLTARSEITSGPNNVSSPKVDPDGVGRYDTAYSLNVYADTQLRPQAGWATAQGTWRGRRFPVAQVEMARTPYVNDSYLKFRTSNADIGDILKFTSIPQRISPLPVELMQRGIEERLSNFLWSFKWNLRNAGLFRINDLTSSQKSVYRAASGTRAGSATTLAAGINSSALSFTANIAAVYGGKVALWGTTATKPGNFPQDIIMDGEQMTISGISGTSSPQTFTVSARGVNGTTAAAHSANAKIQVAQPFYATL